MYSYNSTVTPGQLVMQFFIDALFYHVEVGYQPELTTHTSVSPNIITLE